MLRQLHWMLIALTNAAFEKLHHQNWRALTRDPQCLRHDASKEATVGTGKNLN
jgi:hypothetical protein